MKNPAPARAKIFDHKKNIYAKGIAYGRYLLLTNCIAKHEKENKRESPRESH
jgi:hypothetical protein